MPPNEHPDRQLTPHATSPSLQLFGCSCNGGALPAHWSGINIANQLTCRWRRTSTSAMFQVSRMTLSCNSSQRKGNYHVLQSLTVLTPHHTMQHSHAPTTFLAFCSSDSPPSVQRMPCKPKYGSLCPSLSSDRQTQRTTRLHHKLRTRSCTRSWQLHQTLSCPQRNNVSCRSALVSKNHTRPSQTPLQATSSVYPQTIAEHSL